MDVAFWLNFRNVSTDGIGSSELLFPPEAGEFVWLPDSIDASNRSEA